LLASDGIYQLFWVAMNCFKPFPVSSALGLFSITLWLLLEAKSLIEGYSLFFCDQVDDGIRMEEMAYIEKKATNPQSSVIGINKQIGDV
jgi:hypothetical protein